MKTYYRMRILGTATELLVHTIRVYLKTYNLGTPDGAILLTDEPDEAICFLDAGHVLEAWRTPSTVMPLRPDGHPNRPITIFTIETEKAGGDDPPAWPAPGALNIYTCGACGGKLVSRDRDQGTTPFMISCGVTKGCPGPMRSAVYPRNLPADLPAPSLEWIKPTPAELAAYLKTQKKRDHAAIREHVARGGLLDIPIRVH